MSFRLLPRRSSRVRADATRAAPSDAAAYDVEHGVTSDDVRWDEPVAQRELPPMDVEDVARCYLLFLGREAESEAVIEERARQTPFDILIAFVGSAEFDGWIATAMEPDGLISSLFQARPSQNILDWAARIFAATGDARRRINEADTVLALLAVVLALPVVRAQLVRCHGQAGADERSARVERVADRLRGRPATRLEDMGTSAEDVEHLYLLLFNRPPESEAVAGARPHSTVLDCMIEMLVSLEFSTHVLPAALSGRLGGGAFLPSRLREWTRNVFGIELGGGADRHEAVTAILKLPVVRDRLMQVRWLWSVGLVIEALERQPPHDVIDIEPTAESFSELVRASGLFSPEWYLMRYADLKRAGVDAFAHFVSVGMNEGRDPGPEFETAFYLEQDSEIANLGMPPLEHYLRIGRYTGLLPRGTAPYERWLARFSDLTADDRSRIVAEATRRPLPPVVCIHIVREDAGKHLDRVRAAIADQVGAKPALRMVGRGDGAYAPRTALDGLPADAVILLSADDAVLRPEACYAFACALRDEPALLAYSDHDHVRRDGERIDPVFKPAMSPDFMRRLAYAGPVAALSLAGMDRTVVAEAIEAASIGDAAAAFAALFLRVAPAEVARVPIPLFALPCPEELEGIFARARHEPEGRERAQKIDLPADPPRVCILIPTRDRKELLEACIDSILADTDYPRERMHLLVIDNDSQARATLDYLDAFAEADGCEVVRSPGPFNFARICNDGAAATDAVILVFLNNDTTVREADWLTALVVNAMRPEIGVVGAQLLYPDDTVQHGGVILGLGGVGGHRLIGVPVEEAAARDITREMVAVTGACFAMRREVFEEAGGFDEALTIAFNDVALCISIFQAGYRNLYLARPLLYHHESKSRGLDDTEEKVSRNTREAIYTRDRFPALFHDDPSYSPNLSLIEAGALAAPPRVPRPWRRDPTRRRVLIAASVHGVGYGVASVVAMQAERFRQRGWEVLVGGPITTTDRDYPGCRRIKLSSSMNAAAAAISESVDLVIAHTPPYFSIVQHLGAEPIVYAYDHGEPPPELFADGAPRRRINLEKRFAFSLVHRVFAISQAIRDEQFVPRAMVLRNGNSHLARWSPEWATRRDELRRRFGFGDHFVVLNVCRFRREERLYKGVDDYARLAAEMAHAAPQTAGRLIFVLAGQGEDEDIAVVRDSGLTVFANVSNEEMAEIYAASDLYVSLSRWEGYNLGIGQALAMGLEVVASDIPAHREFGVPTGNALPKVLRLVAAAFARRAERESARVSRLESWDEPLDRLVDVAEADLAASRQRFGDDGVEL